MIGVKNTVLLVMATSPVIAIFVIEWLRNFCMKQRSTRKVTSLVRFFFCSPKLFPPACRCHERNFRCMITVAGINALEHGARRLHAEPG